MRAPQFWQVFGVGPESLDAFYAKLVLYVNTSNYLVRKNNALKDSACEEQCKNGMRLTMLSWWLEHGGSR